MNTCCKDSGVWIDSVRQIKQFNADMTQTAARGRISVSAENQLTDNDDVLLI